MSSSSKSKRTTGGATSSQAKKKSPSPEEKWFDLCLAIYPGGMAYKHWALFVNNEAQPLMFHAQGSEGRFRFEERNADPQKSNSNPEIIKICDIHEGNVPYLRSYARKQPLNRGHGWNCQDYVLELIETAEEEEIIAPPKKVMRNICGMIEGLA